MRTFVKIIFAVVLLVLISCTDRKKQDAEMRERIQKIEEIDSTVQEINSQIETDIEELEEALKELDSL